VPGADQLIDREIPLRTLYLLDCPAEIDENNSVRAQRLRSGEATVAVIASTHNNIVKTPDRLERQLRFAGQLVCKIPVLRLSYARRFDALSSVYEIVHKGAARDVIGRQSAIFGKMKASFQAATSIG